jgi:hypothetical protein
MRIVATLAGDEILQVEKNPPNGEPVSRNGQYMVPVAEGVKVAVEPNSFVLPSANPDSVVARNFAGLLVQFPQYENILYNPLIEGSDVDDLDPAGVLNEGAPVTASHPSRFQIGRGTGGPLPSGNAANSVAVLPQNDAPGPGLERPGVLVTDTIDVGPLTGGVGATEFVVYWYIYEFETTDDVNSSFGLFAGQNTPALRRVIEVDQEPSDFEVFISVNNGANFFPVERLVPIAFCNPATLVRLAFKNTDSLKKRYVAHYGLLF